MSPTLKTLLEETTDALTLNPGRAAVELAAEGKLVGPCEFEARVRDWTLNVDEPATLGGTGRAPNPLQLALVTLCSSQAITYRLWSEKLGMTVEGVEVSARGTTDLRGLLGITDAARPGFSDVAVELRIHGPEGEEAYERLRRAVEEHCPVLDIFAAPVPFTTRLGGG